MGWQDWIFDAYQVGSDERRVVSAVISLVYGFVYVLSFSTIKPSEKHKKKYKKGLCPRKRSDPTKKKASCSLLHAIVNDWVNVMILTRGAKGPKVAT
jgi:hypothetical protein